MRTHVFPLTCMPVRMPGASFWEPHQLELRNVVNTLECISQIYYAPSTSELMDTLKVPKISVNFTPAELFSLGNIWYNRNRLQISVQFRVDKNLKALFRLLLMVCRIMWSLRRYAKIISRASHSDSFLRWHFSAQIGRVLDLITASMLI